MEEFLKVDRDDIINSVEMAINPVHSYDLLKKKRHEHWEGLLTATRVQWAKVGVNGNENEFRCYWLKVEIERVKKWISKAGLLNRFELLKYESYLNDELSKVNTLEVIISGKPNTSPNKKVKNSVPAPLHLMELFKEASKYKYVMDEMVSHDFLSAHSYKWVYRCKSPASIICAFIATLERKQYLKRTYSPSEIQSVIMNTFEKKISTRTIQEYDRTDALIDLFGFIKYASQISQIS